MNSIDFFEKYGRAITPQELGKFLDVDPRTLKKYCYIWGGIEVAPGVIRFFEYRVEEVLNGKLDKEAWKKAVSWQRNGEWGGKSKDISRCNNSIKEGGNSLGKRRKRKAGKGTLSDKFGIFNDSKMDE